MNEMSSDVNDLTVVQRYSFNRLEFFLTQREFWHIARTYLPNPVFRLSETALPGWDAQDHSLAKQLTVSADSTVTFAETIAKPSFIGFENLLVRTWRTLRAIGRCGNAELSLGMAPIRIIGGKKPTRELYDIVTKGTHPEELERAVRGAVPETTFEFSPNDRARPNGYQDCYGGIVYIAFDSAFTKRKRARA